VLGALQVEVRTAAFVGWAMWPPGSKQPDDRRLFPRAVCGRRIGLPRLEVTTLLFTPTQSAEA